MELITFVIVFLNIVDTYLKIVLTSWPATILLIVFLLLFRHRNAIDHFIKNRMTGIGLDGVKGDVITAGASDSEVKTKNVTDATDEEEIQTGQTIQSVTIEDGISKPVPNTVKQEVYERYKKRVEVEDMMQTILISKFRDLYKPHVKLTLGNNRSIILDGLLTTYSGSLRAVEIKYISKESPISLRFSLARLLEKLPFFGIEKLTAVIIADNLTLEEVMRINNTIKLRIKRFFFSLQDDRLIEIPIPPKNNKLFE